MTSKEFTALFLANVRRVLDRDGLTQAEFARRSKMSAGNVSRMLSGARPPTAAIMARCAGALGVHPSELLLPEPAAVRKRKPSS